MLLGLTGGIGSGKSTAAKLFAEFGFERHDADHVIKTRILTSPEVLDCIRAHFGPGVFLADGAIDRVSLAQRVFTDDAQLRWLEELLHPPLFRIWRALIKERGGDRLVFEVPLLFEKGLENWFDFTVCVATTSPNQLARLIERGMSNALAEQRISKQLPLAQKIELADFVLSNDGSLSFLRAQIETLVSRPEISR